MGYDGTRIEQNAFVVLRFFYFFFLNIYAFSYLSSVAPTTTTTIKMQNELRPFLTATIIEGNRSALEFSVTTETKIRLKFDTCRQC